MASRASAPITIAVARPFVSRITWRRGTMMRSAQTLAHCKLSCVLALSGLRLDRPIWRRNRALEAIGHIFRHMPMPKTNKAGATGIKTFQNACKPTVGQKTRAIRIAAPMSQTSVCAMRQMWRCLVFTRVRVSQINPSCKAGGDCHRCDSIIMSHMRVARERMI